MRKKATDCVMIKIDDIVEKVLGEVVECDNTIDAGMAAKIADAYVRFYVLDINRQAITSLVRAAKEAAYV